MNQRNFVRFSRIFPLPSAIKHVKYYTAEFSLAYTWSSPQNIKSSCVRCLWGVTNSIHDFNQIWIFSTLDFFSKFHNILQNSRHLDEFFEELLDTKTTSNIKIHRALQYDHGVLKLYLCWLSSWRYLIVLLAFCCLLYTQIL